MSNFVKEADVRQESFDWGTIGWRLTPDSGSRQLVIMDVTLEPGGGHDFHRHPGQEEMIIVKQGRVTQYIEQESTTLAAGDSVYLDEGVIHASFNESDENAYLQVVQPRRNPDFRGKHTQPRHRTLEEQRHRGGNVPAKGHLARRARIRDQLAHAYRGSRLLQRERRREWRRALGDGRHGRGDGARPEHRAGACRI